ncbi:uncharacterized protein LOC114862202 [Betta splendens]|uniref:Uncharacterized protein LOC114862202 n=1 Tax=Betta splendens TaxID=158456 RepID=A0A6P7NEP1_BETSP|nr:uncharacterized protein LOC114862202 [Betta splendens]
MVMKMKNYLLPVFMLVMATLVHGVKNHANATKAPRTTTHAPKTTTRAPGTTLAPNTTTHASTTTTANPPVNLEGKMFTMSLGGGGMSFSAPHAQPRSSSVSVCLRYIIDYTSEDSQIFTLSPSSSPLTLGDKGASRYVLSLNHYDYSLLPNVYVWSMMEPELWTSVCVVVDSGRNVIQAFHGSHMSIRKLLSRPYEWSGEQVLDFSGFDGQLTDVQVWDYPLRSSEVYNYMSGGRFGRYRGSALSWSSVWYKLYGNTLLEEAYGRPVKALGRSQGRKLETVEQQLK